MPSLRLTHHEQQRLKSYISDTEFLCDELEKFHTAISAYSNSRTDIRKKIGKLKRRRWEVEQILYDRQGVYSHDYDELEEI